MVRDTWIATVFGFCYLFVWGYIADLSMVPGVCDAGAPCGQGALRHPSLYILRGQNIKISTF